jgi:hypothetical protein
MRERLTRLARARWFDLGLALAIFTVGQLEPVFAGEDQTPLNDPHAPLVAVGFAVGCLAIAV